MLGNLVGKDLAGMAVSWAKVFEVGKDPPPTPPSYGKCRGGVRKTSKTCSPKEAVRKKGPVCLGQRTPTTWEWIVSVPFSPPPHEAGIDLRLRNHRWSRASQKNK